MGYREVLVAEYLEGLGLCGVYALGPTSGWPIKIGFSENVERRLMEINISSWEDMMVHDVFWCRKREHAQAVEVRCHKRLKCVGNHLRGEWFDVSPDSARESIISSAEALGIPFESNGILLQNAEQAIDKIEAQMKRMQSAGEMKLINKGYKEYRMRTSSKGDKVMNYQSWLGEHKKTMVRTIAENARMVSETRFGDIMTPERCQPQKWASL